MDSRLAQKKTSQSCLSNYFLKNGYNFSMNFDYPQNNERNSNEHTCTFIIYSKDNNEQKSDLQSYSQSHTYNFNFSPYDKYVQTNMCFKLIETLCEENHMSRRVFQTKFKCSFLINFKFFISKNKKNKIKMNFLFNCLYTFSKTLVKINNYIFHRHDVEHLNRMHIITYYFNNNPYKIIHKHGRKKVFITKISSNDEDVTKNVKQFLGPFDDFHGCQISPIDMGYKKLRFEFANDKILEFEEKDKITF